MIDYRRETKWTVYIHIVSKELSGYEYDKYYVGVTSNSVDKRWGKDGSAYKSQRFMNAINKYGWNNIQHEIFASNLTKDEACNMEKTLITLLKSNRGYGYNYTNGGDGTSGYIPSEEVRKRIGLAHKGHIVKPETIEYIRAKNKGRSMTETSIQQMINNLPDRHYSNNNMSKCVYQFTKDKIFIRKFNALAEARDMLDIKSNGISRAAKEHHSYKGYLWAYEEDIIIENNIFKIRDFNKDSKCSGKKKMVYQFTLDGVLKNIFVSKSEAYKSNDDSPSAIKDDIKNLRTTSRGRKYIWRTDDGIMFQEDGTLIPIISIDTEIVIYQFDLYKNFIHKHNSLLDVCSQNSYNINLIKSVLNHKRNNAYGYIWRYQEDVKESGENPDSFFIKERM